MQRRVWTPIRRWMSNLAPLLAFAIVPPIALYLDSTGRVIAGFVVWACFPPFMWLSLNFLGLLRNGRIRSEMRAKLRSSFPDRMGDAVFVGFARPKYRSLLHHHEDVGWLVLLPESLEFVGDSLTYSLPKADVTGVRFAPNVNTLLGLGRWVSVEARHEGKRVRMLVEPRERATLLGNFLYAKKLRAQISKWAKSQR